LCAAAAAAATATATDAYARSLAGETTTATAAVTTAAAATPAATAAAATPATPAAASNTDTGGAGGGGAGGGGCTNHDAAVAAIAGPLGITTCAAVVSMCGNMDFDLSPFESMIPDSNTPAGAQVLNALPHTVSTGLVAMIGAFKKRQSDAESVASLYLGPILDLACPRTCGVCTDTDADADADADADTASRRGRGRGRGLLRGLASNDPRRV